MLFLRVRQSSCIVVLALVSLFAVVRAQAQQTLGGITGTVTDSSGDALSDTTVTAVESQTQLTRTVTTNSTGAYSFVNLPIGSYTLTFAHDGFDSQKIPSIVVQADRTVTLNADLKVGSVSTSVEVEASPLLNAVDTTNGYVLDKSQIEAVPLATGSFTGLAILTPGVNAELLGGTGANTGLGNQPIWANGQRDTSNTFMLNGVDASNLFNGKSTSSVGSNRIINNTGAFQSGAGGAINSGGSVYLAIGQALPTPAPETITEVRVNASMYDAEQGSTSGAHIDMSTASGTNTFHGSGYINRGTNWLNAAPFFFKQDPSIPAADKNPQLHRWTGGFTFGAPILKDKLFAFIGYQQVHVSDQETGISHLDVPPGLTDDRSDSALAALAKQDWGATVGSIDPVARFLMNYKLPNGQYLIPSATTVLDPDGKYQYNSSVPGTSYFFAKQGVANLDWNANSKDTIALKYYYQHDPGINPYAYSSVAGFAQNLDAGSQVISINNTWIIRPNLSTTQTFGFIREKEYGVNQQLFTPDQAGISLFGSPVFPGISVVDALGNQNCVTDTVTKKCVQDPKTNAPKYLNPAGLENHGFSIGAGGFQMGSYTGVFQNRFMPSANAIWTLGRHTVTFGGQYAYTQLNMRDNRSQYGNNPGQAMISIDNFADFLGGGPLGYNANYSFATSAYLVGDANRYLRAPGAGAYVQDKFQMTPTLSLTAGLRYDWNGAFNEKNGRIYNFEPSDYSYNETTGIVDPGKTGFVFPSNYKYPSPGVSATTLTGRQWGIAPRVGFAWSPKALDSKVVVRGGGGLYYDRGELFTYLSPGYASGVVTGGPYGVAQSPPFVNAIYPNGPFGTIIPNTSLSHPFCDPTAASGQQYSCADRPAEPSGSPSTLTIPSKADIAAGELLPTFAVYDRKSKLPYTMNFTLDVQWQPSNDLLVEVGYVGNLGRHQVIPLPFNQPGLASPGHPIHGENYSYGYCANDGAGNPIDMTQLSTPGTQVCQNVGDYAGGTFEGGNVDLRVPYIGYSAEALRFTAAGVSSYNALQAHVEKRLSHGLQAGFSYTYSHALDEQSALGLFYNGNNPLNLRDSYASADFDRTHAINFNYLYHLPNPIKSDSLLGKFVNDWSLQGITVLQSGQPYSIVDFSGSVGSLFYSTSDGITNPILPLKPGVRPKQALTGHSGAFNAPALDKSKFYVPAVDVSTNGVPPCGPALSSGKTVCDIFETQFSKGQRNIFRQAFQKRADASLVKTAKLTEGVNLRYSFDVFNLTNTPSFDIPSNEPNEGTYNESPAYDAGNPAQSFKDLYPSDPTLGYIRSTIGSARQIQMTLHVTF
jgi:hypothetical protein